jgi:hypothetical protein
MGILAVVRLQVGLKLWGKRIGRRSILFNSLHSSDAAVSELIDLSTSMDGDMIEESI